MGQVLFYGKKPVIQSNIIIRRQIHVMLAKGMNITRSGIYRIWFGDHYYIGRSKNIRTRAKQHMKDMQRAILNGSAEIYQMKMYQYIKDNPSFEIMQMEVLEECTDLEMYDKENKWLIELGQHPKCLNINAFAGHTSADFKLNKKGGHAQIETQILPDYTPVS